MIRAVLYFYYEQPDRTKIEKVAAKALSKHRAMDAQSFRASSGDGIAERPIINPNNCNDGEARGVRSRESSGRSERGEYAIRFSSGRATDSSQAQTRRMTRCGRRERDVGRAG